MKTIKIQASNLSKASGHNKYTPIKIFIKNLKTYNEGGKMENSYIKRDIGQIPIKKLIGITKSFGKSTITDIIKENYEKSIQDIKLQDISETVKEKQCKKIEKKFNEKIQNLTSDLIHEIIEKDVEINSENIIDKIKKIVPELEQNIESETAKTCGVFNEDKDLDQYNSNLTGRNEQYYRYYIRTKVVNYLVIGKVDGIDDDGNIVETKHRRNRLFSYIPDYEKVQLEVYMRMTGTHVCTHIQNYKGEQDVNSYDRDNVFWNEIICGLEEFGKKYLNNT